MPPKEEEPVVLPPKEEDVDKVEEPVKDTTPKVAAPKKENAAPTEAELELKE